ncbi:hypothetical protein ACFW5V_28530 [Streptomyces sp. NPDC058762]|uniref:hypothetical protein n=1 Tax=Streptomyces sp. NPDC058762 TaxID=3346629 RepID=UPI00369F549E
MSVYPTIRAGQRITAGLLTSMLPIEAYKRSTLTRTATTVTADDPDLQFALEANAVYFVEFFVHYQAPAAELIKTTWSVPADAVGLRSAWGVASGVATADPSGDGRWGVHAFTTTCTYGTRNSASQTMLYETGQVETTSAGTVAFQWAQNTSGLSGVQVCSGSYGRAKRLA